MSNKRSMYLERVFDPEDHTKIVNKVCQLIRKHAKDAEYVVMSGLSGMLIGGPVAHKLKKKMIVVRKPADLKKESHCDSITENIPHQGDINYVVVDDFICTGATLKRINDELIKSVKNKNRLKNLGIILYDQAMPRKVSDPDLKDVKYWSFQV